jgi:hypothetical protein
VRAQATLPLLLRKDMILQGLQRDAGQGCDSEELAGAKHGRSTSVAQISHLFA